jgi:hypothetical protein
MRGHRHRYSSSSRKTDAQLIKIEQILSAEEPLLELIAQIDARSACNATAARPVSLS